MKVSCAWLKDHLPLTIGASELAEHLGLLGVEVASIEAVGPAFSGVVAAEILSVDRHPNADRLSLCKVSDGAAVFSVVCGAPNVAAGQRVPLARLGARLPNGLEIKRAKIRGVESEGMLCSAAELGLASDAAGIHQLDSGVALGSDVARLLGGGDQVLDLEITPNRPDLLSHRGLARELAVYFDLPLKDLPAGESGSGGPAPLPVGIADPRDCSRYLGRAFDGVRVGPSPGWLAERLKAAGLRPINNVVDVTNYVLMELGQPLHAFDLDRLEGPLSVRRARAGEKARALDGREHSFDPDNLLVADARGPVAVAGVIGGEASAVTDKTSRVFLESACFAPGVVRKSAKRLGLRTDSSYRFERGTDCEAVPAAAARAAALLRELCGAKPGPAADLRPRPQERPVIEVSVDDVNRRILGTSYPEEDVLRVLKGVSASFEKTPAGLRLTAPSWRHDLASPRDLAEEVARHLGYDKIPSEASPVRPSAAEPAPLVGFARAARAALAQRGFLEAMNYDFVSEAELERCRLPAEGALRLANPLSPEWALLRTDLLPGLLRAAAFNFNRKASSVRLFELGRVYGLHGVSRERTHLGGVASGDATALESKQAFEAALGEAPVWRQAPGGGPFHPQACAQASLDGVEIGWAGLLHPSVLSDWDVPGPTSVFILDLDAVPLPRPAKRYRPVSPFPLVERDISILVDAAKSFDAVLDAAGKASLSSEITSETELVGMPYEGKGVPAGKKSYTLRLTFARMDRTLRDEEIVAAVAAVVGALEKGVGARLRS